MIFFPFHKRTLLLISSFGEGRGRGEGKRGKGEGGTNKPGFTNARNPRLRRLIPARSERERERKRKKSLAHFILIIITPVCFSFGFVVIVVGEDEVGLGAGGQPNALLIKDKTERKKKRGLVRNPCYNSHASEVWYIFVLYS